MQTATAPAARSAESGRSYGGALAVVTTLFFIWGSLTSLNDVLIPYAQGVFHLKLAASMLIQTAFFSAYFMFSVPASRVIDWIGYKKAVLAGLGTMAAACLGFYPAARIPSFPFFLAALVVLAAGITILQVAANPYVAVLGEARTASSRLNLAQAFNSLGTAVFPWVGAHLILGGAASALAAGSADPGQAVVKLYVHFFAVVLLLLASAIALFDLPEIASAEHALGEKLADSVWRHPNLVFGALAIFVYVGAEVSIGSSISNYLALDDIGRLVSPAAVPDAARRYQAALGEAARFISLYWLGSMIGRFAGSALLQKIKAGRLLAVFASAAAILVAVSVAGRGALAMWSIVAVGLCNSIMFPCIFAMGIAELGPLTGDASGILNMAIVGGAVIPWLVGRLADLINRVWYPAASQGETSWGQGIHYALALACLCYLYILFFAVSGSKTNSERRPKAA